jgi:beta-glucuronidase
MNARRCPHLAALLILTVAGCGTDAASVEGGPPVHAHLQVPKAVGSATPPRGRPLVRAGQPGRLLLGGRWHFKLDNGNVGVRRRYMRHRSLRGWRPITVPYDWNGAEAKLNRSSVGWYRRDFVLPRTPRGTRWIVRFEGAGHQSTVYLNGRAIARHWGNYLPFEAILRGLRPGANRLVVRVSSLRRPTDLTHWRRARFNGYGNGGWWNFGGVHREVSVRPARVLDIGRAQALTRMRCPTCRARVQVRALVRNLGRRVVRPQVTARAAGQSVQLRTTAIRPGRSRELVGELTVERPRLWGIGRGNLYTLDVTARGPSGAAAGYRNWFGIRDLRKVGDARMILNGRRLYLRGISLHEDHIRAGSAWRLPHLRDTLRRIQELGATVVRSHYPLHPYLIEELDRRGVMVWDAAPINVVQNDRWRLPRVRRAGVQVNEEMVLRDRGHPSVLVFSVADELGIPVTRAQQRFLRAAAARVRALDPTTMVALDRVARYGAPDDAHPVFRIFDVLGINEYFGWYRGALPPRPPAYTRHLGKYFDTLHRQQPNAALFVTEFGAEANRRGSVREKGTFAYQSRYIRRHIEAAESRPFINGAIVWALRDFRVHEGWDGFNPKPDPPWNRKGIILAKGVPKPAFYEVRRTFARLARQGR